MDSKLNVLEYLIKDANSEIEYINNFKARKEEAEKESDIQKDRSIYWAWVADNRYPSKQKIKDNLKMIRRISLEIEKELDEKYKWGSY